MKKYIMYGILSVVILGLFMWAYVTYAAGLTLYTSTVETMLLDKTDSFLCKPTAAAAIGAIGLHANKWQRTTIRLRTISTYEYTESAQYTLPGEVYLLSNPDARDTVVSRYIATIDSAVEKMNGEKSGCDHSSVYGPLISEANALARSTADNMVILAYTDGCENTSLFSIYRDKDKELLMYHPDKVRQLLSQHYGRPENLHGVKICFIFKPMDDEDNENFRCMVGFYKSWFESVGAEVCIGANSLSTAN